MRIHYVCHACLVVETGDLKIATDPWFTGSAYCGRWHLFPKPVDVDVLQQAQVILLSHGHEDHLHEPSLRRMPKSAQVFYPYTWYGGTKKFLQQLGYQNVVEALPQKCYRLTPDTAVTYIVNGIDSIIVLESNGKVFVNINDALHPYPAKIIELFVRFIRGRWPRISTVFCGFGGASYFPNTIHCPGKNDREIGEAREQLFAHNFCQIVDALKPETAVPFAADFALLSPKQRWINHVRFPRTRLAEYFRLLHTSHADTPRIQVMYSGDMLIHNEFKKLSPYWEQMIDGRLWHLLDQQYAAEIDALSEPNWISDNEAEILQEKLLENVTFRRQLFDDSTLAGLTFSVKLTDLQNAPYLNISLNRSQTRVERQVTRAPKSILQLETSSQVLLHSFASPWGGDAITIGYGCDIQVFDQVTIRSGLDSVCVRLLTRQPQASRHWRVEPVRIAKHLLTSQTTRTWVTREFLRRSSEYNHRKTNDIMREWLFRSRCEVCRACDLPLLDENFAAKLSA